MRKCVLAYSGGLDTSVAVRWIAEQYDVEVIALAVDVGEEKNYEAIRQKALDVGAIESLVVDANRPLLAKTQVEVAHDYGAQYVAHGCTGKGNDQVRFEVTYAALDPALQVIAPAREWGMTREEEIEYAQQHDIPVPVGKESPYSTDTNLWGRSIECGQIEDPTREGPEDAWEWTNSIADAPQEPTYLEITFERGVPLALDGDELPGPELISRINAIGGENAVGRIDMMENRLVGIKSRELYEAPAAVILLTAHRDLESLTLDRETMHFKPHLELRYAELVYYGLWYTPLREAIDAFVSETQKRVSGKVTVKLHKGNCQAVARESERSLYQYELATYAAEDIFDQSASPGFIHIWGLPVQVAAQIDRDADNPSPPRQ